MTRTSNARRGSRAVAKLTTAATVASLAGFGGVAGADSGAINTGGAALAPSAPVLRDAICLSACVGLRKPTVGALVQASGRNLASVDRMSFPGAIGRVVAPVVEVSNTTAIARVPRGARDGAIRLRDTYGNTSGPAAHEFDLRPRSELGTSGPLEVSEAEVTPLKAFYDGVRKVRLVENVDSEIALRLAGPDHVIQAGGVVKSYFIDDVAPNTTNSVWWGGKDASGGPAANGPYHFRISAQAGGGATVARRASASFGFKFFRYIFPVRGPHTYGDGIGAPRAGHTHQGQDVFARCGTPLVAARGGTVQFNGYHGAAGNYIVIDGRATGIDFAYMHLRAPSALREGQRVRTGQKIGEVGATGNAGGCHLHYEMWSAPGWYEGGQFLDPAPPLQRWDRWS